MLQLYTYAYILEVLEGKGDYTRGSPWKRTVVQHECGVHGFPRLPIMEGSGVGELAMGDAAAQKLESTMNH